VIRELGFNSVRLPFSNALLRADRSPRRGAWPANPALAGKTPLQIFDATVAALTDAGLLVILNNHSTHAMWCCNFDDDGLWWTAEPQRGGLDPGLGDDRRPLRGNPAGGGGDLRNEIRSPSPRAGSCPDPQLGRRRRRTTGRRRPPRGRATGCWPAPPAG
jgi:hypothetical protein